MSLLVALKRETYNNTGCREKATEKETDTAEILDCRNIRRKLKSLNDVHQKQDVLGQTMFNIHSAQLQSVSVPERWTSSGNHSISQSESGIAPYTLHTALQ